MWVTLWKNDWDWPLWLCKHGHLHGHDNHPRYEYWPIMFNSLLDVHRAGWEIELEGE